MTEKKMIELCKRNNRKGQFVLYKRYSSILFTVTCRYFKNKETAKDALQEIFNKIFIKIDQYKGVGSFEGWLKRIAVNHSIDKIRIVPKDVKFSSFYDEKMSDGDIVDEDTEDAMEVVKEIPIEKLILLIQGLAPQSRLIFNMFVIDDYSHKEISEHLGIHIGTSKSSYFHSRKKLVKKLNDISHKKLQTI